MAKIDRRREKQRRLRQKSIERFFRRKQKKNAWVKFCNPSAWVAIIMGATILALIPFILAGIDLGYGDSIYMYGIYAIFTLLILYTVFITVNFVIRMRREAIKVAGRYAFTKKLLESYELRSIFASALALICNLIYMAFLWIMAVRSASIWYASLAVYCILLMSARGGIIYEGWRNEHRSEEEQLQPNEIQKDNLKICTYCGILLITVTLSLTVAVVRMLDVGADFRIARFMVYVFTAFTLYKVISVISQFIKGRTKSDFLLFSVRYINFAATLVSILTLQTAIFAAFPPAFDASLANAISGAIVCLALVGLGIRMILFSTKHKKNLTEELKEQEQTDNNAKEQVD